MARSSTRRAGRRIAVVGCGHVGAVTAACLAELGHHVCGVDVDAALVARLRCAAAPFMEPGLPELLRRGLEAGRLGFTTSYGEALAGAEFIFLCVNTPSTPTGAADLRYVRAAVAQIAVALPPEGRRPLLVIKSTSPIGTGETIDAVLDRLLGTGPLSRPFPCCDGGKELAKQQDAASQPPLARNTGGKRSCDPGMMLESQLPSPMIAKGSPGPSPGATVGDFRRRAGGEGHAARPRIVANPEFLREGNAVHDFFHPDRIVVGANDPADARAVAALYRGIEAPRLITDLRSAELIKYVSNAFLATRVAFINEVAQLCERIGADIDTVARGAALDPRIGGAFFTPGLGYGGSCLPKDVAALCHTGDSEGVTMRVLTAVQQANAAQRKHAVNVIRQALGGLEGATLAAWGCTFKGGTEDLRESPALDVIALLRNEGVRVRLFDPSLDPGRAGDLADEVCAEPLACVDGAVGLAVLTDWPQFRAVPAAEIRRRMAGDLVYDGRNLLDRAKVEAAGLRYVGVGRGLLGAAPPGRSLRTERRA